MKDNYAAWNIALEQFHKLPTLTGQLRFLIGFAVLAPSSHNSQPWKFVIGQDTITLMPDPSRMLSKSDPFNRQLYISLGCALENLLIAADYYNFKTSVEYFPEKEITARISFQNNSEPKTARESHLVFSIAGRRTNRNKYDDRRPPPAFISMIKTFQDGDMKIDVVQDAKIREELAAITLEALLTAMDNPDFREELSHYIRSNITKEKTGMPGFGFGMPTPVSLVANRLLKRFNMNRLNKKQDETLLKQFTPAFGIISTKEDNPLNWLKSGRIFERIALEAQRNGVKTAPMAAAIETGDFYKKLQQILGLSLRPQVFFRMGYCGKEARENPRLLPDEVIASI